MALAECSDALSSFTDDVWRWGQDDSDVMRNPKNTARQNLHTLLAYQQPRSLHVIVPVKVFLGNSDERIHGALGLVDADGKPAFYEQVIEDGCISGEILVDLRVKRARYGAENSRQCTLHETVGP